MSRPSWLSPYITKFHVLGTGTAPAPAERERGEAARRLRRRLRAGAGGRGRRLLSAEPQGSSGSRASRTTGSRSISPGERRRSSRRSPTSSPNRPGRLDRLHPPAVHTHHARSYDNSNYIRAVADFTTSVPPDTGKHRHRHATPLQRDSLPGRASASSRTPRRMGAGSHGQRRGGCAHRPAEKDRVPRKRRLTPACGSTRCCDRSRSDSAGEAHSRIRPCHPSPPSPLIDLARQPSPCCSHSWPSQSS